jgi:hypothetical protein
MGREGERHEITKSRVLLERVNKFGSARIKSMKLEAKDDQRL